MSPELIHTLACYRKWLQAMKLADWANQELRKADEFLSEEDRAEFEVLATKVKAEFED